MTFLPSFGKANYLSGNSLHSKRSRSTRAKFGPREGFFRIRAARKMGREQKGCAKVGARANR